MEWIQVWLEDALWSGLAAVGFAVLFNVPPRLLAGCILSGAIGHTVRTILTSYGASMEISTLVGAVLVGVASVGLSRWYRVPSVIFTVTGAIPLVPGVFAYQTMVGLLNAASVQGPESISLLAVAATNGIRTALILGAIAFGIAAPTLLFRRPRPVV